MIREGDFVLLISEGGKNFLVKVEKGYFSTHKGNIDLSTLIGRDYGSVVESKKGERFYVVRPTIYDFLKKVKRATQVMYPKDIGYAILKLGVTTGCRVIECGTGSGALTMALAFSVKPFGTVYSYERNPEFSLIARENLSRVGFCDYVVFKVRDVEKEGFDESDVDAIFIDVREPVNILWAVDRSLKAGSSVCFLLPTTNQVSDLIRALESGNFIVDEICEILLRKYKINPDRFRPDDMMNAHTGYLLFARKVLK